MRPSFGIIERMREHHGRRIWSIEELPLRARACLAAADLLDGARRREVTVRSRCGDLFLAQESFAIDLRVLLGVFTFDLYRSDFRGAVVLDLGAHKGYYGARAVLGGAVDLLVRARGVELRDPRPDRSLVPRARRRLGGRARRRRRDDPERRPRGQRRVVVALVAPGGRR